MNRYSAIAQNVPSSSSSYRDTLRIPTAVAIATLAHNLADGGTEYWVILAPWRYSLSQMGKLFDCDS